MADIGEAWEHLQRTKTGYTNLKVKPPTDKNSEWYKALLALGVIVSPDPPPPPPPPPPATGQLYGCPWYGSSLGNIEIGKNNQTYSYGFDSLYSGQMYSCRFFLIYRASGYYSGDGGQIKVDLCADSGGRPGQVLAGGACLGLSAGFY